MCYYEWLNVFAFLIAELQALFFLIAVSLFFVITDYEALEILLVEVW
jgi:hypothetical protein